MYPSAKFRLISPCRCEVRNLAPFLPHFPNDVMLPSIFDVFQKMNIAIGFPIGKYIWIPSFSIVAKLVVMLHELIAYLLKCNYQMRFND